MRGLEQYYLRTKYHDQSSGRFTRRDDYEGSLGNLLTLREWMLKLFILKFFTLILKFFTLNGNDSPEILVSIV